MYRFLTLLRVKMYKSRIKCWGLEKKCKENEMRALVQENYHRMAKGRFSSFHIRGKKVDFGKVVRYWERKNLSIDQVVDQRGMSKTPEGLRCMTPLPSPVQSPKLLAIPERMFILLRRYHFDRAEYGVWRPRWQKHCRQITQSQSYRSSSILVLLHQCDSACGFFANGSFVEGRHALDSAFAGIQGIVQAEHSDILPGIFQLTLRLCQYGRQEISLMILRHFSAMGGLLLGEEHPIKVICGWLSSLGVTDKSYWEEFLRRGNRAVCDTFQAAAGSSPKLTRWTALKPLWIASTRDDQGSDEESRLWRLLNSCNSHLDDGDLRKFYVPLALADCCYRKRKFHEVIEIVQPFQDYIRSIKIRHGDIDTEKGLADLAHSQDQLGKRKSDLNYILDASELCVQEGTLHDDLQPIRILVLERWLREEGEQDAAALVETKRLRLQESMGLL